jgi:hypothetical protein
MKIILFILSLFVTAQAWAEPKPKSDKDAINPGDVVVEVESLQLTDCEKLTDANASAGAAIKITSDTSAATGEVTLPVGTYTVHAYVMCSDMSHDTFWLEVGANPKIKVFPSHAKLPQTEWSRAGGELPGTKVAYIFDVKEAKPMPLKITAKETGMKIDRLVFRLQTAK